MDFQYKFIYLSGDALCKTLTEGHRWQIFTAFFHKKALNILHIVLQHHYFTKESFSVYLFLTWFVVLEQIST